MERRVPPHHSHNRYEPYIKAITHQPLQPHHNHGCEEGSTSTSSLDNNSSLNCSSELMDKNGSGASKAKTAKGINPGLVSAYKGHHYCNPTNHFWPLLYESGLISEGLTYENDFRCLEFGIGMTNIVARTTRSAAELSKKEIADGKEATLQMIARLKPLVVCFNGKGIYEIFSGGKCVVGRQQEINNTAVYVMPSTSGLVAQYPSRKDKLVFFNELKQLRDDVKRTSDISTGSQTQ